jgi:hypothetical protein
MGRRRIQESGIRSQKSGRSLVPRELFSAFLVFLLAFSLGPLSAVAQHAGHQAPAPGGGEKKIDALPGKDTSSTRTFLLEGFKASFSIMDMAAHKKMLKEMKMKVEINPQATHNIAVTLTDTRTNAAVADAVVKMKVINPKGKDQIKLLDFTPAMNQYAGDFNLSDKGRYQILILFKSGGKKHAAGFYYALK